MKRQKGGEILDILRSQGMVASSEIGGSKSGGQDQVLETAYKQFREDLYQMGITEALMPPKDEILKILRSRGISSSQSGGSSDISGDSIGDQGQLLEAGCSILTSLVDGRRDHILTYFQPLTYI